MIDLNELDRRIKQMNKPLPQDVVNLIVKMYKELKSE